MERISSRALEFAMLAVIGALTVAAAYIHFWVGGILLLINAAGAMGLLVVLVGSYFLLRQARPLVLLALAGYSAGSIGGWAIMGPYFDLAYLTKGIELVLIAVIGLELWRSRAEIRPAFVWLISTTNALSARVLRRAPVMETETPVPAAAASEE